MSVKVDKNEPELFDYYLGMSVGEVIRGNFNQSPGQGYELVYPDFTVFNGGSIIGTNRKQAVEWLGGLDAWETQLHKEANGPIDLLVSVIEGQVIPDGNGTIGMNFQEINYTTRRNGHSVDVVATGEKSHWPYKLLMGKIQAMWDIGIPVIFTANILGTATFIAELHHRATEGYESQTFKRFIKEKYAISETDKKLGEYIQFLMHMPSVGETTANILVDYYPTFKDLFMALQRKPGEVSKIKIPASKEGGRSVSVGQSTEMKMREFLGL